MCVKHWRLAWNVLGDIASDITHFKGSEIYLFDQVFPLSLSIMMLFITTKWFFLILCKVDLICK